MGRQSSIVVHALRTYFMLMSFFTCIWGPFRLILAMSLGFMRLETVNETKR